MNKIYDDSTSHSFTFFSLCLLLCFVCVSRSVYNAYLAPFEIVSKHFALLSRWCCLCDVNYFCYGMFALLMTLLNRMNGREYLYRYFWRKYLEWRTHTAHLKTINTWMNQQIKCDTVQENMNMNEYSSKRKKGKKKIPTKLCFKKFSIGFFPIFKHSMDTFIVINEERLLQHNGYYFLRFCPKINTSHKFGFGRFTSGQKILFHYFHRCLWQKIFRERCLKSHFYHFSECTGN